MTRGLTIDTPSSVRRRLQRRGRRRSGGTFHLSFLVRFATRVCLEIVAAGNREPITRILNAPPNRLECDRYPESEYIRRDAVRGAKLCGRARMVEGSTRANERASERAS